MHHTQTQNQSKISSEFLQNLKISKDFLFYIFSCVAIFVLIYIPAYLTPFHSDDYAYFLQGLSLEVRINHYLSWSGRFIVDYITSMLLNLFSRPVYMALNSLVALIVLINISLLPKIFMDNKFINSSSTIVLWGAFFLYWLCNPILGETTFWIVGSTNYLWTLMWVSFYLLYILNLLEASVKPNLKQTALLVLLGFFVGLSNEGNSASMLFFTFVLFFIYKTQKKTLIIAFVAIFIGFLFLYLAPGNFARLHIHFQEWLALSLSEKLIFHLHRLQELVSEFFLAFASIIFSLFSLFVLKHSEKPNLKFSKFALIFFVLAFFSIAIFAGSPSMMRRTLNTFNFFIILCASFSLYALLSQKDKNKAIFASCLFLVFVPYFTLSWASFTYAVSQIHTQAKIIDEVIKYAKENGESKAQIPEFYWTDLVRYSDVFGVGHHNPYMPTYYDIDDIIHIPINFNYAIIKTQKPVLSQNLSDDLSLNLFYDNPPTAFRNARNLVFEFNQNLLKIANIGNSELSIELFLDDKDEFITIKLDEFLQIGDKFYYAIELEKIELKDIKKINLYLYNPNTEQNSASFSVNLSNL